MILSVPIGILICEQYYKKILKLKYCAYYFTNNKKSFLKLLDFISYQRENFLGKEENHIFFFWIVSHKDMEKTEKQKNIFFLFSNFISYR